MSRDLSTLGVQLHAAAGAIEAAQRRAIRTATAGMVAAIESTTAAVAPARTLNVGKGGARIGIESRIEQGGDAGTVSATGPYHLIERDTSAHRMPRVGRKTKRTRVLLIPGVGYRRFADHPGTSGRHPFARGIAQYAPEVPKVFEAEVHRVVVRTFR